MTYRIAFVALASLLLPLNAYCAVGDTTAVNWANLNSGRIKNIDNVTFLSAGTTADGDGTVLQLGYFSAATTANNFAGTFIPLTGMGTANTAYASTSIGDTGNFADGRFNLLTTFRVGDATAGNNLPAAGTPLTVLYYNNKTIASSTAFGAVSNDAWAWVNPTGDGSAAVNISVTGTATGLEFLQGGTFNTNIAIPEPSTWIAVAGAFAGILMFRKRLLRA